MDDAAARSPGEHAEVVAAWIGEPEDYSDDERPGAEAAHDSLAALVAVAEGATRQADEADGLLAVAYDDLLAYLLMVAEDDYDIRRSSVRIQAVGRGITQARAALSGGTAEGSMEETTA